jgi:hypothetical protein
MASHGIRMPAIGGREANDVSGPAPAGLGLGQVLVDDLAPSATNNPSLVLLSLQSPVLRPVVRAPSVHELQRRFEL